MQSGYFYDSEKEVIPLVITLDSDLAVTIRTSDQAFNEAEEIFVGTWEDASRRVMTDKWREPSKNKELDFRGEAIDFVKQY